MKIKLGLIFLFILINSFYAQKSSVQIKVDDEEVLLPAMDKYGLSFIPVKSLEEILGGQTLYNSSAKKIEIKFPSYIVKFTLNNQFMVVTSQKDGKQEIIQIPVATLPGKDDILIPLRYTAGILSKSSGRKITLPGVEEMIAESKEESRETEVEIKNEIPEEENKEEVEIAENEKNVTTKENVNYDISSIRFDVKANGTLIRLNSSKTFNKFSQSISDGKLFLNIVGLTLNEDKINSTEPSGLIKKISAKNQESNSRIEFLLDEGYSTSEAIKEKNGKELLITVHNKIFSGTASAKDIERWKFDTIILDAGHGGKDPGAIGINGAKEKDINLAITLKLGELIEKNLEDVKVIYTRASDKFVELYKRGKIANEKNGNLFISIHCNSTKQKPTHLNGFEVYLLRPGRTREAIEIAQMENSVIKYEDNPKRYQELTDENFILVTMAHSSFMKYSENFADLLTKQFEGNNDLQSGGVKQAGFYVLVGASMPSVLVESGYLSNKKNAAYLSSKEGQSDVAESVFNAIKKFKENYDKDLNGK
ncbi:MAG: hypothetical protein C4539_02825 [Ignavibacteriales bacterium]|nr:MAG: hypothetical protein C4539_02825 [Ignavibacteriales bacterium]